MEARPWPTPSCNSEELERDASDLRREFEAAAPFPHLVVDDLLRLSPAAASAFPDISWPYWNEMRDRYQQNKLFCADPTSSRSRSEP